MRRRPCDRKLEKAARQDERPRALMKSAPAPRRKKDEVKKNAGVVIDFDRLHERVRRISLPDGFATNLFWSPDAKKLAFTGAYQGQTGTYIIEAGDSLTPKLLTATTGTQASWLKQGNQIVWVVGGVPTSTPGTASATLVTGAPTPTPVASPKKGKGLGKGTGAGRPVPACAGERRQLHLLGAPGSGPARAQCGDLRHLLAHHARQLVRQQPRQQRLERGPRPGITHWPCRRRTPSRWRPSCK